MTDKVSSEVLFKMGSDLGWLMDATIMVLSACVQRTAHAHGPVHESVHRIMATHVSEHLHAHMN